MRFISFILISAFLISLSFADLYKYGPLVSSFEDSFVFSIEGKPIIIGEINAQGFYNNAQAACAVEEGVSTVMISYPTSDETYLSANMKMDDTITFKVKENETKAEVDVTLEINRINASFLPFCREECTCTNPTNKTVKFQVTINPASYCNDPDKENTNIVGTVLKRPITSNKVENNIDLVAGSVTEYTDSCSGATVVSERTCPTPTKPKTIPCAGGTICKDGACVLPQQPAATCVDSDGGADTSVKGFVKEANRVLNDSCLDQSTVSEFYCEGNFARGKGINCPADSKCKDGACVVEQQPTKFCTDSDFGENPNEKGTTIWGTEIFLSELIVGNETDRCLGESDLLEFYCGETEGKNSTFSCAYSEICENGICIKKLEPTPTPIPSPQPQPSPEPQPVGNPQELATSAIEKARDAITSASKDNKDVQGAKAKLEEADDAYKKVDYKSAIDLAKDAEALALNAKPIEQENNTFLILAGVILLAIVLLIKYFFRKPTK